MTSFTVATFAERPDLTAASEPIIDAAWHEFVLNDDVANRLWDRVESDFPDFQFLLLDADETVLAVGNSIPLVWDGRHESLPDAGWRWVLESAFEALDEGRTPNAVSALSVSILPAHQGRGISRVMIKAMSEIALRHGFRDLIAPVRPNMKPRYPLTPIERYVAWTTDEGAPFDPWLRVHWRLGAQLIRPCLQSMRVEGSVADWERWTDMRFPDSGDYIVPGALVPVTIDRDADVGRYVEPNVWMHHRLRDAAP
jgi:GNAT superfamily N-acetyltransferase